MYQCCLCDTQYHKKEDAIKCVNKCGRAAFDAGRFVHKKIYYSNPVHQTEGLILLGAVYDDDKPIDDQINAMMDAFIGKGISKNKVEPMRHRILNSQLTDEDKKREFNLLLSWFDQSAYCYLTDARSSNG